MTPADKAAAALHEWPDLRNETTPTDEQHDKAELARWLRIHCIGRQPMNLRTAIGIEARDLIVKLMASDLELMERPL